MNTQHTAVPAKDVAEVRFAYVVRKGIDAERCFFRTLALKGAVGALMR